MGQWKHYGVIRNRVGDFVMFIREVSWRDPYSCYDLSHKDIDVYIGYPFIIYLYIFIS